MAVVESQPLIETIYCDSWQDFSAALRTQDGNPIDPLYRGHAQVDWALVGPSERDSFHSAQRLRQRGQDVAASRGAAARGQFNYFRRLATGMPNVSLRGLSDIDIEALARHHGLCSNLLDWTGSPYVAAFFAFTGALDLANAHRLSAGTIANGPIHTPEAPVCIWRISNFPGLAVDGEFEIVSVLSDLNYWQKAQSGVFSRLTHPRYVDLESYFRERGLFSHLKKFVIPGNQTVAALRDLELMNITYATLFPDLRGAALQANIGMSWRFA